MPDLELPEVTLHYEIGGSGPPLLMIAGMMSDSASWIPLLPLLQDHFTLIRPDNRTTGRTTPWDAPASVDHFAQDCASLLDHLDCGPAHVVGHSLGGLIALRLARCTPDHVATVTFAASAPMRLSRNVALFETLLDIRRSDAAEDTWLRALFPWLFAPAAYDLPGAVDQALAASLAYPYAQSTEAMAHQLAALRSYKAEDPAGIACPVQALLAEDDLLIPRAAAQASLGITATHAIPDAGHSIHWDAPQAVARHLIDFINGATHDT